MYKGESEKYDEKEKARVYESPTSDPVYVDTEREIIKLVNEIFIKYQKGNGIQIPAEYEYEYKK